MLRSSAPGARVRFFDDVIEYAVPAIGGHFIYPSRASPALTLTVQQTWSLACYTSTAAAAGLGNYTLLQNMIKMLSNYVWQAKAAACTGLLVPPQHGQDDVELFVGAFTSMQFGTLLAQRPPAAERNSHDSRILAVAQASQSAPRDAADEIDAQIHTASQFTDGGNNTSSLLALRHKLLPTLQDAVFGLTATPPYVGGPEERGAMCLLYAVVAMGLADTPPSLSRNPTADVFVSHAIHSPHVSAFGRQCDALDALVDAFLPFP